jgi:hypothetical protein
MVVRKHKEENSMPKAIVVGGGWAGVSAALAAKQAGADVTILERADMLLGTGLVGGIMRNNGRFTATAEAIAMGADEMFATIDSVARHQNIEFPGHMHADLYDVAKIEPAIKKMLQAAGVTVRTIARATDVQMEGNKIKAVVLEDREVIAGDVFVETTGTAGPMGNCAKYGNGCVMCIYRCPSFGPRVSITAKTGVKEMIGQKGDGSFGAMSGSCKLHKESLSEEIVEQLNKTGVVVVPIPERLIKKGVLEMKACH